MNRKKLHLLVVKKGFINSEKLFYLKAKDYISDLAVNKTSKVKRFERSVRYNKGHLSNKKEQSPIASLSFSMLSVIDCFD